METRLKEILNLVNQWLKFAETKNAALLGSNSAIVFVIIKSFNKIKDLPLWLQVYIYVAGIAILVSAALSLLSFVPKTEIPWISMAGKPSSNDNLIFFGDISKYDLESYLQALYCQDDQFINELSKIEKNYAEQIIVNSRITLGKYKLFSIGAWITLFAILTPIVSLLVLFLRKRN